MSWLSDHGTPLLYVVGSIFGLLKLLHAHHSIASIKSALLESVRRYATTLAVDPANVEMLREYLEKRAKAELARIGGDKLPASLVEFIVHEVIERVLTELTSRLIPPLVSAAAAGAEATISSFSPPATPDVPPLDLDIVPISPSEPPKDR